MSKGKHLQEAKDFQKVTADRIIDIFKNGRRRVLLSDEVGLGKTIIAKTVVENAKELPGVENDGVYRVVYVCSNQNIIQQNTRNLGMPKEDILLSHERRLSMQHLILKEKEMLWKSSNNTHLPQQLIPLTPSTSFSITNGAGNGAERAVIFNILCHMPEFANNKELLSRFLQTKYMGIEAWENLITKYARRISDCGYEYILDIEQKLRRNKTFANCINAITDCINNDTTEGSLALIGCIRHAFAEISLEMLDPDLVIMDEFQRFSELLNPNENSEESMIASKFFSSENTRILLLSATPYKPFTTLEELNESNSDEQHQDFLKLMKFLFNDSSDEGGSFRTIWEDYSNKLSHICSKTFDALIVSKQKAESKMYEAICRTERYRKGLIKQTQLGDGPLPISEDDILAYCQMQQLLHLAKEELEKKKEAGQNIGIIPHFDIHAEYVKSSPYLLSFMKNYQESKTIEAAFHDKGIPYALKEKSQLLLLKNEHIDKYRPIKPANAKLAALEKILFKNHAERLLWVPASHPYYTIPQSHVFAKNRDFSKVLVFSAWEMVPRMLSAMLSYQSEQKNIIGAYKYKKLTYNTNKKTGENLLAKIGGTLLKHPSPYLVKCYTPENYLGEDINEIIRSIQNKIQNDINQLGLPIQNERSEASLLSLIKKLDDEDTDITQIPYDAAKTLAQLAIASPGVCMLRTLRGSTKPKEEPSGYKTRKAEEMAEKIVNLFNKRESSAAVIQSTTIKSPYYEQVLDYCVMGNLQAVLDEFCHMIDEKGQAETIAEKLNDSFISNSVIDIHTTSSYCKKEGKQISIRRNFAYNYAKVVQEKDEKHNFTLQQAFNSPFRPFVLATTSVGQEGLDFHWYARKIVHWNLPSNPVDLEQRDGRINRYKCHAIRRNVAKFFGKKYSWNEIFEEAGKAWRIESLSTQKYSEMVPYWCLPPEKISNDSDIEYIERIVPIYPMSIDSVKYKRLVDILSLYRLTMGQPRQEELLQLFEGKVSAKQMEQLLFDLSPYSKTQKN